MNFSRAANRLYIAQQSLSGLETVLPAQEQMRRVINEVLLKEYFPENWQDMLERYAKNGVDLMELKEMPLILLSHPNRLRQPVDQLFRKHNAIPNIALETALSYPFFLVLYL